MNRQQKRHPWLAALLLSLSSLTAGSPALAAAPVRIAYVDWSSSVASLNLVCALLREQLDQSCEPVETSARGMWRTVAHGQADVLLSAWLPDTHASYLERYGEDLVDLGPNLEGTRTGLVVPDINVGRQTGGSGARTPTLMPVESIADLADYRDKLGGRIVGIDPEAGIMADTEEAIDTYDLRGFRLTQGSEANMTTALSEAIARKQWIVITGWQPHWMFGRWSLRFLDDPERVYGGTGAIHTMVRQGFAEDNPQAYALLDQFSWTPAEMEQLLVWISQHQDNPYAQAQRWLRTHPQRVKDWLTPTTQED
ncbi:glycine betaine ABC transporter substrate-binding protein [Rhabdochromatium marinum]|uniref:glycine betaine ABC transporter substrate-binding protein n=1 Tax=Rhabdochromatium marinum TaxID=48729 RepID=UPI001908332A|nr:glycine betaine ABC transporter substrate-binding protein [Rhabdochromatium marinum]MBK1649778.1 glycine/betaine ABC transporter substrate-binding protein [Rhabdochromatium marinum]